MHARLHGWHVALGRVMVWVLLAWSLSGLTMLAEPAFVYLADPVVPVLKAPPLRPEGFVKAPAALALGGAVLAIEPRQVGTRSWYEITAPDGTRTGVDAATGAAVPPYRTAAEVQAEMAERLPTLPVRAPFLVEALDDDYRKGDLPAWRLPLAQDPSVVLYVSARDGSLQRVSTRTTRFVRWCGMALHTWNLEALKRGWDGARRWGLCLGVALPMAVMAGVSWLLLRSRDRRRGAKSRS